MAIEAKKRSQKIGVMQAMWEKLRQIVSELKCGYWKKGWIRVGEKEGIHVALPLIRVLDKLGFFSPRFCYDIFGED